ncbi:MAG: 50S ribosomal protein L24 [Candidatus Muirbacterium halophilum]|nr:50S ribosomal protein L24 [Candidatus Muirbacterium halophilum]MCK9475246.1 50S ribosomal protein L24 [Candidatus Muirbacterium halophilum]
MMKIKVNHIKKGDKVLVIAGKEKGKSGEVLKVDPENGRAIISKVNFIKKHQKPNNQMRHGGIIEKEASIHVSNLQLICPHTDKPTRVGHKEVDGQKVRYSKKSGEIVDKV